METWLFGTLGESPGVPFLRIGIENSFGGPPGLECQPTADFATFRRKFHLFMPLHPPLRNEGAEEGNAADTYLVGLCAHVGSHVLSACSMLTCVVGN